MMLGIKLCLLLPLLFNIIIEIIANTVKQEKQITFMGWKGRNKTIFKMTVKQTILNNFQISYLH